MKKKTVFTILLLLLVAAALCACSAGLTEADVKKANANKWHVTYDLTSSDPPTEGQEDYDIPNFGRDSMTISHFYNKAEGGTKILAPEGNELKIAVSRPNHFLEGWYPTKECVYTEKWNFDTDKITGDTTLYAHWLPNFEFVFVTNEGGGEVEISRLQVKLEGMVTTADAPKREGYTMLEWYADPTCTQVWDTTTKHSGKVENGEQVGRTQKIYTEWIAGDYTIVKDEAGFSAALMANANVYLVADLDYSVRNEDDTLKNYWLGYEATYSATIEGNNHTVSGIELQFPDVHGTASIGGRVDECGAFNTLASGATLKNITFSISVVASTELVWETTVGGLAANVRAGVTFENVTLTGTFTVTNGDSDPGQYNFGLVGGFIASNASLSGLDYTGMQARYEFTGENDEYSYASVSVGTNGALSLVK